MVSPPSLEKKRIFLLTGVPRSGTTLSCNILNHCEDVCALVEPISFIGEEVKDKESAIEIISNYAEIAFQEALKGKAFSKLSDQRIADNIIESKKNSGSLREEKVIKGTALLTEPLSESGTLVIKHNALFAALLHGLREKFHTYAIVRNPLSVLASWQTVNLPVNQGKLPVGEKFSICLQNKLQAENDVLQRQLIILDWFFQQFSELLDRDRVFKYEDVVSGHTEILDELAGKSVFDSFKGNIRSENKNYDFKLLKTLSEHVLNRESDYWNFYSKEDIQEQIQC